MRRRIHRIGNAPERSYYDLSEAPNIQLAALRWHQRYFLRKQIQTGLTLPGIKRPGDLASNAEIITMVILEVALLCFGSSIHWPKGSKRPLPLQHSLMQPLRHERKSDLLLDAVRVSYAERYNNEAAAKFGS